MMILYILFSVFVGEFKSIFGLGYDREMLIKAGCKI